MVYGLVSGANRDPRAYDRRTSSSSTASPTTTSASPAVRTAASAAPGAEGMQVAVEEWLRVIPDFDIATDDRAHGARGWRDDDALSLPLAWEVPA